MSPRHAIAVAIVAASLLLAALLAGSVATADAPPPLGTDRFAFDTAGVPDDVRPAIVAAANARAAADRSGVTGYAVGVYTAVGDWGLGTLASARDGDPPDWRVAAWFLARREGEGQSWAVAVQGEDDFVALVAAAPDSLISERDRALLTTPRVTASGDSSLLKFPWDHLERWWYTSAWHSGTAVDFANPAESPGIVLAAADGVVRIVCDDGQQTSVRLESGAVGDTAYVHLRSGSVPAAVVGAEVPQGCELGRLYDGAAGSGWYSLSGWPWPPCDPSTAPPCNWSTRTGCCYLRFNTTCGAGTGPHLHWVLPSRNVVVDGWEALESGCWTRDGVVRCSGQFGSTNVRIAHEPPPDGPRPPLLLQPAGGAWLATRAVTLAWSDEVDGVEAGSPRQYELEVRGPGWTHAYPWAPETEQRVVVPADGAYTWRVRARDGDAVSAWSDERAVNVAAGAPPTPLIAIEGEGCEGVANNVWQNGCAAPGFRWESVGGAAAIEGYAYCWSERSDCRPTEWATDAALAPDDLPLIGGVGSRFLNVVARDVLGNVSSLATFALRYDAVPPSVSVAVNGGAATVTEPSVVLHLLAGDVGAGPAEVRVAGDEGAWSTWQPYADRVAWELSGPEGEAQTVHVQVRDGAGNESAVATATVTLEPGAPQADGASAAAAVPAMAGPEGDGTLPGDRFGVVVAGGSDCTNTRTVTVFAGGPGVVEMRLSSDGGYSEEGWQPAGEAEWTLPPTTDYLAARRVYAWLRDADGHLYGPYFDEVIHDQVRPQGRVVSAPATEGGVRLAAYDDSSGVADARLGLTPDLGATLWVPYTPTVPAELAGNTFYAQLRDRAGNVSYIYGSDGSITGPDGLPLRMVLPLVVHGFRR